MALALFASTCVTRPPSSSCETCVPLVAIRFEHERVRIFEGETAELVVLASAEDGSSFELEPDRLQWNVVDPDVLARDGESFTGLRAGTSGVVATYAEHGEALTAQTRVDVEFGFSQLAAGIEHVCGLSTKGRVYCWGRNVHGELGASVDGPATCRFQHDLNCRITCVGCCEATYDCANAPPQADVMCRQASQTSCAKRPVAIASEQRFVDLAAGFRHTCGITDEDDVVCWGHAEFGQRGPRDGLSSSRHLPERIEAPWKASALHAGFHDTCVLDTDQKLRCVGINTSFQLGVDHQGALNCGPTSRHHCLYTWQPVELDASGGLAIFLNGMCGLGADQTLRCLGTNIESSLLDLPQTNIAPVEARAVGFNALSGRFYTGCGFREGTAECWGMNHNRQSAPDAATGGVAVPTPVGEFTQIAHGLIHGCGLNAEGQAFCWGYNGQGQLGRAAGPGALGHPVGPVETDRRFTQLVAGSLFTCGIERDTRKAWCWGANDFAQHGAGENVDAPEANGPDVVRVLDPE